MEHLPDTVTCAVQSNRLFRCSWERPVYYKSVVEDGKPNSRNFVLIGCRPRHSLIKAQDVLPSCDIYTSRCLVYPTVILPKGIGRFTYRVKKILSLWRLSCGFSFFMELYTMLWMVCTAFRKPSHWKKKICLVSVGHLIERTSLRTCCSNPGVCDIWILASLKLKQKHAQRCMNPKKLGVLMRG